MQGSWLWFHLPTAFSSAPALTQPLTKLINYFITNRLWLTIWKSSNITPVCKKAGETNKTCYRQVSVLPALFKIYEQVVADQVYHAFALSLSLNLSGYLALHLCCTSLLKMEEDWRLSLDNKEAVATLAIDLSKAFASVCHSQLLAKLRTCGFTDQALGEWKLLARPENPLVPLSFYRQSLLSYIFVIYVYISAG